jgi:DNA replication protein DnaC
MTQCRHCGGSGVLFDRSTPPGELRLCDCIQKACDCGGHPPFEKFDSDGAPSWCPCAVPRKNLELTRLAFRDAGIPRKFMWKFSEDFDTSHLKDDRTALINANKIVGFINTISDKSPDEEWTTGFYLWGPAGGGKTLLGAIILQELMRKYAMQGRFVDLSRQFFQRLKSSFDDSESYGTAGRIMDELIHVPFLVIDDFGTQRNTQWELEMLYNLIDSRYEEERTTIITSNQNIAEYKNLAEGRIYSRVLEMCRIMAVNLPDYRERFSRISE